MKKEPEIKMNVFQRIKSIVLGYFILMMNCCFFIACESGDDKMPVTPIEPPPTETETRSEQRQQAIDGIKRYLHREIELVEELEQIEDPDELEKAFAALPMKSAEIFKEETGIKYLSRDLQSKLLAIHSEENPEDVEANIVLDEEGDVVGGEENDIDNGIDPNQLANIIDPL